MKKLLTEQEKRAIRIHTNKLYDNYNILVDKLEDFIITKVEFDKQADKILSDISYYVMLLKEVA